MKLPGAPKSPVGLQSAARDLLDAVDAALPAPAAAPVAVTDTGWERIRDAAEVLRGEVHNPGGHRRRRARGIAERLMGLRLGAAQDELLNAWGDLYAKASGTLHGVGAEEGRPAACTPLSSRRHGSCWCRFPAAPPVFWSSPLVFLVRAPAPVVSRVPYVRVPPGDERGVDTLGVFKSSSERTGLQERPGVAEFRRDGAGQAGVVPPPGRVEEELAAHG